MSKPIPDELAQEHVLLALKDLDEGVEHSFGEARGYLLRHEGKTYSPKAVLGVAVGHLTGEGLHHSQFSGGEGSGQANGILRKLGFQIEAIESPVKIFVSSRGYTIPVDSEKLKTELWFNMWQKRMWPFNEVSEGDILYWYDAKLQQIVWRTKISAIERFKYQSKQEVTDRLIEVFAEDPSKDPYFSDKEESGYCFAFKVTPLERISLSKPKDFKFPQGGWLRGTEDAVAKWLESGISPSKELAREIESASEKLSGDGYFDPSNSADEREKVVREIVQRQGQPEFRKALLAAYDGKCAITGCDIAQALEAAHICRYMGPQTNSISNGILLRSDIHTLLDLQLIGIEPETLCIHVSTSIKDTCAAEIHGKTLNLPDDHSKRPSTVALKQSWTMFLQAQQLE
jgi:putative restriction endonuclease